ncbi:MAG: broad-spectrum mercury transporter MerE [Novosphingobium sp.]|jgi:mercuric ion transport protein|nr:broad-spectrum mercury transporter MerE [Novosphingobium sp.]
MTKDKSNAVTDSTARPVLRQRISAYLFTALALATCPCHLPILLVLLAGTTAGAYLGEHWVIAALAMAALFVLSVTRALRAFNNKP